MKLIIITGPSGSGKTTISNNLSNKLKNSYVISTDDFYRTDFLSKILSIFVKSYFDQLISLKKKSIIKVINTILNEEKINYTFKYDYKKKKSKKIELNIIKIDHLIIEGIFTLDLMNIFKKYDYLLINVKTNKEECLKRIIKRDKLERGNDDKYALKNFKKAWKIYKKKENKYKSILKYFGLNYSKESDLKLILEIISIKNP